MAIGVWLGVGGFFALVSGIVAGRLFSRPAVKPERMPASSPREAAPGGEPEPEAATAKLENPIVDRHRLWLEHRESGRKAQYERMLAIIESAVTDIERCAEIAGNNQELQSMLDTVLDKVRHVGRDLREELSPLGRVRLESWDLRSGLDALVSHVQSALPLPIYANIDPSVQGSLTASQANHVLAIVREALANAIQHSEASRLALRAAVENRRFVISVSDDGKGFDLHAPISARHRGLAQMQARSEAARGLLQVESARNVGTIITLTIPLNT